MVLKNPHNAKAHVGLLPKYHRNQFVPLSLDDSYGITIYILLVVFAT